MKASTFLSNTRILATTILLFSALLLPPDATAGNLEGRFTTITLDGNLSDWLPGDVLYGPADIVEGAPLNSSFTNVFVANDETNLYVALQLPAAASISNSWTYNLFIDADMAPATGFNGGWMSGGYDHLVQYGSEGTTYSVYNFSGAAQGDWAWNWLSTIGYAYTDTVIEWAIPLSSLGTATNKYRMEFNVSGTGVTTETWAYKWESGVATYTVAPPLPTTAPTLESVEGAPNKVAIVFSKPVTAATAGAITNYTLSGGLTVLSASHNSVDQRKVTLTTSPQTQGTDYTLTVNRVADATGTPISPGSQVTFTSSILIDGSFDDWQNVPLLYSNPQGDPSATDFQDVYGYNDSRYLYLRVTLWEPSDLFSSQNNLFMDTDNNINTGNMGWGGAELLIQGSTGYQEKNGGFNEGPINGLNLLGANVGQTNYEFRVSLSATYASDGLPVFTANQINFAYDGETNWVSVNRMPQGRDFIPYMFVLPPPGPLQIKLLGSQVELTWPGAGTLESSDSIETPTWNPIPEAVSGYAVTPTAGSAKFFRLVR